MTFTHTHTSQSSIWFWENITEGRNSDAGRKSETRLHQTANAISYQTWEPQKNGKKYKADFYEWKLNKSYYKQNLTPAKDNLKGKIYRFQTINKEKMFQIKGKGALTELNNKRNR